MPMSLCAFNVGRCHGDPLFFIAEGKCNDLDPAKLDWARFRAKMAAKSPVHQSCDLDTCYEWEKCSGESRFSPGLDFFIGFDLVLLFYLFFLPIINLV